MKVHRWNSVHMLYLCLCFWEMCVPLFLLRLTLRQYHYMTTANVSTCADSLAPESERLPRKEGSPSSCKWADAGPKLTAFQYANFLFIYLLLNDLGFKPMGIFFPLWKKNIHQSNFSCWPFVIRTSKSSSRVTLTGKFALLLVRWMSLKVYPLIPISAYVILAPLCRHIFVTSQHISCSTPSLPALIRVMPTHRSSIALVRQQDR